MFTRIARKDATIISIDLPKGIHGYGYNILRIPLYKSFARSDQKILLFRSDSHKKSTIDQIKSILKSNKLEFLFIDGDHRYEGVKKDFEMYRTLVKNDGIVAFHDIIPQAPETQVEVSKYWNEIKNNYIFKEIIKDKNQKWAGIGVIYYKE